MRKQTQVVPQEMVQADNPEMMADFCNGYAPLRDGMRANRDHWTERAKAEGLDVTNGNKAQNKEKDDYGNLWEKYWNMDPENFIWGIDPNEAPPEVVIERVVFSPKKKAGKVGSEVSNGDQTPDNKASKGRRKKKAAAAADSEASNRKSPAPSTHSDSSSKNSKACRIM